MTGAETYVVSEGDSSVQTFKFCSLGLASLVKECIVTDVTCGGAPIAIELFDHFKDAAQVPPCIERLFDQLSSYSVKSKAFYSKLIHVLVEQGGSAQERLQSPRFLTAEEWQRTQPYFVAMVGDRYRKILSLFCKSGPREYRVIVCSAANTAVRTHCTKFWNRANRRRQAYSPISGVLLQR